MRIGFVATYPPIECGIGTYASYLKEALIPLGNEVFVISQFGAAGKNVYSVYNPFDGDIARKIYHAAARLTPDLVHIQHAVVDADIVEHAIEVPVCVGSAPADADISIFREVVDICRAPSALCIFLAVHVELVLGRIQARALGCG